MMPLNLPSVRRKTVPGLDSIDYLFADEFHKVLYDSHEIKTPT